MEMSKSFDKAIIVGGLSPMFVSKSFDKAIVGGPSPMFWSKSFDKAETLPKILIFSAVTTFEVYCEKLW